MAIPLGFYLMTTSRENIYRSIFKQEKMELTQSIRSKMIKLQEVNFDPFAGPKLIKVISPTQSQLEIWLSCIMGGDDANRSYNESISLKLKGDLNTQAIKSAINTLQDRHEILRSTFSPD